MAPKASQIESSLVRIIGMRVIASIAVLAVLNVGSILVGADAPPEPTPQPRTDDAGQLPANEYGASKAEDSPKSDGSAVKESDEATEAIEQAITVFRKTTAQQGLRIDSAGARRSSVSSGSLWHGRI